jgi:hypothetical protein
MILIDNNISKVLYKDKDNSYSILTYFNIEQAITIEFIKEYVYEVVKNNQILTKKFVMKNNLLFLDDIILFNVKNHYSIKYIKQQKFNKNIKKMLNLHFNENFNWKFLFCIDKNKNSSCIFFKINHALVDGYRLIDLLTNNKFFKNNNNNNIVENFKRNTTNFIKSAYYYIIGTIILVILNIKIFIKICINEKNTENSIIELSAKKTDYIICNSLNLEEIKSFAKKNNITVNDFLYALMIKTDKIYTNTDNILLTSSPINISGIKSTNNICPIFNTISNSYNNKKLLQTVNNTFNNFKYSLFIYILSFIINNVLSFVNINILSKYYKKYIEKSNYIYSNIIGPSFKNAPFKISNIHFLTTAKNKEIIYNIISSNNNINIVCSFQENIIKDKKRFEQCIYASYNSLLRNDNN